MYKAVAELRRLQEIEWKRKQNIALTVEEKDQIQEKTYKEKLDDLYCLLTRTIQQTQFCTQGILQEPYPTITIDEEAIAFPLQETMIKKIISKCSIAPVGKGAETVIDIQIRQGYQLDANRVSLKDCDTNDKFASWKELFGLKSTSFTKDSISSIMRKQLQIESNVTIHPYKLLIYEQGNFFKPHRDTQRDANHFATIVLFFPTQYTGGEFIIRHQGTEQVFDFSKDTTQFHWIAFYADCEHEVLPVKSGYRLCMTFNVHFQDRTGPKPIPPQSDAKIAEQIATKMYDVLSDKTFQYSSLGFLLSHQYSIASLEPSKLKGKDLLIYQLVTSGKFQRKLFFEKQEIPIVLPDYKAFYVAALKQLCEEKGLSKKGTKHELIARLEDYTKKQQLEQQKQQQQQESSSVEDAFVQISLQNDFNIELKLVKVFVDGTGGDEDESASACLKDGFEYGCDIKIVDSASGKLLSLVYSESELKDVPKMTDGTVYPIYGFDALQYQIPVSQKVMATGNEGAKFTLVYSHAMLVISLKNVEPSAKKQKTK